MIYRNKETHEFKGNITDDEKSLYEEDILVDEDGNFNIDYICSIMPYAEFSDNEIDQLVHGFLNIPYIHIKTGNKYYLTNLAIECTNGQEDIIKCVYRNEHGIMFTREFKEFFQKFKRE